MKRIYRNNVAMIVLSKEYDENKKIFVAQKINKTKWEMPQGGMDENETYIDTIYRELKEEITTTDVEIITSLKEYFYYDFDEPDVIKNMKPFTGQKQKYFVIRLKDDTAINLETEKPEFQNHKFSTIEEILKECPTDRKEVYKKVFNSLKEEGIL